jgi:hypothetical protein
VSNAKSLRFFENAAIAGYAVLTALTAWRHEPWSDEANSWLLARDASLVDLWTHLMHYEGTPAIWHTLLYILIHLGMPYWALNLFTGSLGCLAAWTLIRKAPFAAPIRLALPFTFYLFYQYSVVARSYCLLPLLLIACASLYRRADEKPVAFTAMLALMAGVSVHGMILSGAIWASWQWEQWQAKQSTGKQQAVLGIGYALVVLALVWSAWPARDVFFAAERDYSLENVVTTAGDTLANAFTGEWISSLIVVAAGVPLLWRGRGLTMFVMAGTGLCLFNAFVYSNVWHLGILFLAWLFAMWISAERAQLQWMATFAMTAAVAVQGVWTAKTVAFDWNNPYSGSKAAAQYLRDQGIDRKNLYGFGYACVGVQPYFPENRFINFRGGGKETFYDWSISFRNFEGLDELKSLRPEYVLVGYKTEDERSDTGLTVKQAGYRLLKHFEGNLYWHGAVYEPDALDLYRRN